MRPKWLVTLLLFASFTIAVAQTKTATTNPSPSSRPATASKRVLPTIKCVDPESAVSCKSLKQLVDARDSGVLFGIMGDPKDAGRHITYVCPRRLTDTFTIIGYTVPDKKEFKPFIPIGDDEFKRNSAELALEYFSDRHLSLSTVNQWYQDHHNNFLFTPYAFVGLISYQDGELAGLQMENGEWRRSAKDISAAHDDGYAEFKGNHYWIQEYNEIHADGSPEVDDREKIHMYIDGRVVYAHYGYKNRNGDFVDYVLQIHRSTGRFTETFKLPDGLSDDTGTCMIFKY